LVTITSTLGSDTSWRKELGDMGIRGQWSLKVGYPAPAGRDDQRDVLARKRFDGRLDQPGHGLVIDRALRDMDDGSATVQLRPPVRRDEPARRLWMDGADEPDVRSEVAARIFEARHRRNDEPIGQHSDVEQERRKPPYPKRFQHRVGGALRLAQDDVVRQ
jgi:hypothetical protein